MLSRGQEAAPFEVLIAVVLMGFVILVGLNAVNTLNQEKCEGELAYKLNELKHAIEVSSAGRSRKEVNIDFPSCFPGNRSYLTLEFVDDSFVCSAFCEGKRSRCMLLKFFVYESKLSFNPDTDAMIAAEYTKTTCLDINPITEFTGSDCGSIEVPEGFCSTNFWGESSQDLIPEGRYLLVNSSEFFGSVPKVCVYEFKGEECG
jgi:hypothetical protein